jgi:hypothetical protein
MNVKLEGDLEKKTDLEDVQFRKDTSRDRLRTRNGESMGDGQEPVKALQMEQGKDLISLRNSEFYPPSTNSASVFNQPSQSGI